MGRKVNVVLPSGRIVSVDEDVASASQLPSGIATLPGEVDQGTAGLNEERSSGAVEGLKAAGEGLADTLSAGGYGLVRNTLDPDYERNSRIRAGERGGSRFAGEAAGFLLPFAGEAGAAAHGISALGAAERAGAAVTEATGSVAAGRLTQGAIIGTGAHVASTNVTGDPLTIEGTLQAAGIGAILDFGVGKLGDGLGAVGKKLGAKNAARAAEVENAKVATEGAKAFTEAPPSWGEARDAVKSANASRAAAKAQAEKANAAYQEWLDGPEKLNASVKALDKARMEVQSRISGSSYGQDAVAGYRAAGDEAKTYARQLKAADSLLNSTEKWPSTLGKIDKAIAEVRGRYAPSSAEEALYKPKLEGYEGEMVDGRFERGDAYHTATRKEPISEELDSALKDFAERRSQIARMKDGGYRLYGDSWIKDPTVPPDPIGALKKMHELRADFTKRFRSVKFPDLPDVPVPPKGYDVPSAGPADVKQLAGVSRELGRTSDEVKAMLKAGDREGAMQALRGVRSRAEAAGIHDLELPEIPSTPGEVPQVSEITLPGSLRDFARKRADDVATLANQLDDTSGAAFGKLADELGIAKGETAAETVTAIHRKLGEYVKAIDAAKAAEGEQGSTILGYMRRMAKNSVVSMAGYTAYGLAGGVLGAGLGAAARAGGRLAMDSAEDALLGGAMTSAKLGIQDKVRSLVEKWATGASRVSKLAPVTAYLANNFPSGEPDRETDVQKQAANRIRDISNAVVNGPDAAFAAVDSMLGHPADVGGKIHAGVMNALNHLLQMAPKDPGVNIKMGRSDWVPTYRQAVEFAHRMEAMLKPLDAITRTVSDDGHPAASETLWTLWPATMSQLSMEAAMATQELGNKTYQETAGFSRLFRTPLTGLQDSNVGTLLQGLYLPKQQQSAPQGSPTGGAPGRPAAVQNKVAGSNVSALISQQG